MTRASARVKGLVMISILTIILDSTFALKFFTINMRQKYVVTPKNKNLKNLEFLVFEITET